MPNDQMSYYGVQTQYVSIRSTSQKCKQNRENKEETIGDKEIRKEIREQKSREEKKRKDKKK